MSKSDILDETTLTSFAAPTAKDLALFDALSPEQQRALVARELQKGFDGEIETVTPETVETIFREASSRAARGHGRR
jgi:hypothetical protein